MYWPRMTPVVSFISEYVPVPRKDGTDGKRYRLACTAYCPLYECSNCGKTGSGRHIQQRSGVWKIRDGEVLLCMGCWNKFRPLADLQEALNELGLMQRKLQRTKKDGDQNRRAA